ncbi:MAG: hypothetical protein CMJ18_23965 [Phycisphaeraceae bacterium]|nr:hypothetical protein [Phycisphaeraceae bacterium]
MGFRRWFFILMLAFTGTAFGRAQITSLDGAGWIASEDMGFVNFRDMSWAQLYGSENQISRTAREAGSSPAPVDSIIATLPTANSSLK